jgi:hypothetical protein
MVSRDGPEHCAHLNWRSKQKPVPNLSEAIRWWWTWA